MSWVTKLSKWISIAVILCASMWIMVGAWFAQSFTQGAIEKIRDLEVEVSLATEVLASNWQILIVLSFCYFLIGVYLAWKVKKHFILHVFIAISSILVANIVNVLVVSAGFQL